MPPLLESETFEFPGSKRRFHMRGKDLNCGIFFLQPGGRPNVVVILMGPPQTPLLSEGRYAQCFLDVLNGK